MPNSDNKKIPGGIEYAFFHIAEHSKELAFVINQKGCVIYLNPAALIALGFKALEEVITPLEPCKKAFLGAYIAETVDSVIKDKKYVYNIEFSIKYNNREPKLKGTFYYLQNCGEPVVLIMAELIDKDNAGNWKKVERLNKLYAMVSAINEKALRMKSRDSLFFDACCLAVEHGGFVMSWAGILGRERVDRMKMIVRCSDFGNSFGESSFLAVKTPEPCIDIINMVKERGKFVLNKFGSVDVCDFAEEAQYPPVSYRSMAAFALTLNGSVIGVICFYTDEEGFFADEEVQILEKLAANMSFAIHFLESQNEKTRAYEKINELSQAVEQSSNVIMITDLKGKIKYVNKRFSQVSGYEREEILGKNPRFLKSGQTPSKMYEQLWATILKGEDWHGEFQNKKKNGELYWEAATISPIKNNDGKIINFIAIKEEISFRKFLEEKLHHTNKIEAVGRLAAGIAHDFNNILSAINGYIYIIQLKVEQNDPIRPFLDKVHSSTQRAAKLVQGLLAFSKEQKANRKNVDLNEIIKVIEKSIVKIIGEDIVFNIKLSSDSLTIMADTSQVEQIIINMTSNARDAMPGGGSFTIETKIVEFCPVEYGQRTTDNACPLKYALLRISDTGIGMDKDVQEKVFEPFFTTKTGGHSVGIGLSIIYAIVENHKGYINLISEVNQGAVFEIFFPLLGELDVKIEPDFPNIAAPPHGNGQTVLIAEDDIDVRTVMKKILERKGYGVIEAVDGLDAVEKFKVNKDSVDLLILDVIMPKQNGKKAYEDIKSINPDIKALFTSGYSDDMIISKGVFYEEHNFLLKPVSPDSLLIKVKQLIDENKYN